MTIASPPRRVASPSPPRILKPFSVADYHRMIQTGILTDDDPVELLEGWIVLKMPRSPRHDGTIQAGAAVVRGLLPKGWDVRIQSAITTGDSEPAPDLAVVVGQGTEYLARHPAPTDIALLIEVADSSLDDDREWKGRLYARAGIPLYGIINLRDDQVEVFSDPSGPAPAPSYRRQELFHPGQAIALAIGGTAIGPIPVRDLIPPRPADPSAPAGSAP